MVTVVTMAANGPVIRVFGCDELLGIPNDKSPLGVVFWNVFGSFSDTNGFSGLHPQDYIDKLGLRDS